MASSDWRYKHEIDRNCRLPKALRERFLAWLNSKPEFRKRRPTIAELIAAATAPRGPLRGFMELDANRALQKHWYDRAQYLLRHINCVRISVRTKEVIGKPVRAYIPIKIERGGRIPEENYIPAKRVYESAEMKHSVVDRARADCMALIERYERYAEFMDVLDTFETVIAEYRKAKRRKAS